MIIDAFEQEHATRLAKFAKSLLPKSSWRTPDRSWTPQDVLRGFHPRVSDRWAWLLLHYWIVNGDVEVLHTALPAPLWRHDPVDPAWTFIEQTFGPGELEPVVPLGRADLACAVENGRLVVEFGTCFPAKFVLNFATTARSTHAMIVPHGCSYAFTFVGTRDRALLGRHV